MNTKRFISIALTVLMLLTTSTVAFAAGTFTIVAPKVTEELEVGKTIEYKIDPTENPGYAVGSVTVSWNADALILRAVEYSDANYSDYVSDIKKSLKTGVHLPNLYPENEDDF